MLSIIHILNFLSSTFHKKFENFFWGVCHIDAIWVYIDKLRHFLIYEDCLNCFYLLKNKILGYIIVIFTFLRIFYKIIILYIAQYNFIVYNTFNKKEDL